MPCPRWASIAALRGPELGASGKADPGQGPSRWLWFLLRLRNPHEGGEGGGILLDSAGEPGR